MTTEAYKVQVLDDHNGRRLRVDGPHYLYQCRPLNLRSALEVLQDGHICWVATDTLPALADALDLPLPEAAAQP